MKIWQWQQRQQRHQRKQRSKSHRDIVDKLKYISAREAAGHVGKALPTSGASSQRRPVRPPPEPPLVLTAALACDPETDPAVLWHIAREVPELRCWLAANPRASPELLELVSQLGGPGVKRALTILLDSLDKEKG